MSGIASGVACQASRQASHARHRMPPVPSVHDGAAGGGPAPPLRDRPSTLSPSTLSLPLPLSKPLHGSIAASPPPCNPLPLCPSRLPLSPHAPLALLSCPPLLLALLAFPSRRAPLSLTLSALLLRLLRPRPKLVLAHATRIRVKSCARRRPEATHSSHPCSGRHCAHLATCCSLVFRVPFSVLLCMHAHGALLYCSVSVVRGARPSAYCNCKLQCTFCRL